MRNLTALLTLARAKEQLGFDPEKYGLTEQKAANIAMVGEHCVTAVSWYIKKYVLYHRPD